MTPKAIKAKKKTPTNGVGNFAASVKRIVHHSYNYDSPAPLRIQSQLSKPENNDASAMVPFN